MSIPRAHLRLGGIYNVTLASDAEAIRGTGSEGRIRVRVRECTNRPWAKVQNNVPGEKKESGAYFWLNVSQVVIVEPSEENAKATSNKNVENIAL